MAVIIGQRDDSHNQMLQQFLGQMMARRDQRQQFEQSHELDVAKADIVNFKVEYDRIRQSDPDAAERYRQEFVATSPAVKLVKSLALSVPITNEDRVKQAIVKQQREALTQPTVWDTPTDASGNTSFSTMHTRMGAGMEPRTQNPVATATRRNVAYNLTTGQNPNETLSKLYETDALQGTGGLIEQNRIRGGQQADANQHNRTNEERRQFDTRFAVERPFIEAGTAERATSAQHNRQQAAAAGELVTNRQQERTVGSPLNNARVDVTVRSRGEDAGPSVKDGRFNHLRKQLDDLETTRTKMIASGTPTKNIDAEIGRTRKDLEQRSVALGVNVYGEPTVGSTPTPDQKRRLGNVSEWLSPVSGSTAPGSRSASPSAAAPQQPSGAGKVVDQDEWNRLTSPPYNFKPFELLKQGIRLRGTK
jgi:hypothetical protein